MIGIEKQLKKGVLEIIVLKLLTGRDMYGYELMQILDQKSSGYYRLKEGSLYPVLYRLEDNHLIKSYWKSEEGRKAIPRKYYAITDKGKEMIDILIGKWDQFVEVSNKMLSM